MAKRVHQNIDIKLKCDILADFASFISYGKEICQFWRKLGNIYNLETLNYTNSNWI